MSDYLADRGRAVDTTVTLDSESFGVADGYRVFLAGETHTESKTFQASEMLIRSLYEHEGVRYLLLESGLGAGLLMDRYVQTGDQADLDFLMEQLQGTLACTNEQADFLRWLRAYNEELPANRKLHVIGLDIDHQAPTAVKGLSLLLNDSATPADSVAVAVQKVRDNSQDAAWEFVEAMKQHPDEMRAVFGENFGWAAQFCENFARTERYYSQTSEEQNARSNDLRDEAMMANFLFVLDEYPRETFFGEFGSEHVYQSACETQFGSEECNRFGMRLNAADSPVAGEVCSILYLYPDQVGLLPSSCTPFERNVNMSLFEGWRTDAFFSLNEPGSPS